CVPISGRFLGLLERKQRTPSVGLHILRTLVSMGTRGLRLCKPSPLLHGQRRAGPVRSMRSRGGACSSARQAGAWRALHPSRSQRRLTSSVAGARRRRGGARLGAAGCGVRTRCPGFQGPGCGLGAEGSGLRAGDMEVAIKMVVVGNGAVGKSSMIQRYCKGIFTKDYKKTIGVDFLERQIQVNDEDVRLMLWDTAGQEEFDAITKAYYR
ncbi:hypothetical protein U0070_021912, partial [Myodes glareolus]